MEHLSSFIAITVTHPLDTIVTRIQTNRRPISPGYFKGVGWSLGVKGTFWTLYFSIAESINNPLVGAFVSTAIGTTLVNPLAVLKIHAQTKFTGRINYFAGLFASYTRNIQMLFYYPLIKILAPHFSHGEEYAIAKLGLSFISYPCIIVMNMQRVNGLPVKKICCSLWKSGGFYRGFWPYVLLTTTQLWLIGFLKSIEYQRILYK